MGIDDIDAIALSRSFGTESNLNIALSVMAAYPPGDKSDNNLHYSLFVSTDNEKLSFFAQAGFQSSSNKGNIYDRGIRQQSAFVAGAEYHFTHKRFSSFATAEARYYGSSLNFSCFGKGLLYRDSSAGLVANTVGDYLYPLRKYETPFSQWGVFAQYFTCDVIGLTLRGNMAYTTSSKTEASLDYDLNFISATENKSYNSRDEKSSFLYGFFTAAFYHKPVPGLKGGFIITNKGMNLNKSYPTFYLFTMPYIGFRIFKSV